MKMTRTINVRATVLACLLATAGLACAQTTTTTTSSTTSAGTISSFTPDALIISSSTSPAPVTYSYSKTTTYVDQDGNPVSVDTVRSGMPVTVYYTQDGDRMIASKVVVQRTTTDASGTPVQEVKKTTTTTTSSGQ